MPAASGDLSCARRLHQVRGAASSLIGRLLMHTRLLALLACPECNTEIALDPGASRDGDHVEAGTLRCRSGHPFPIINGVPRFVRHALSVDQSRTRDSFGYEWT